MTGEVTLQGRVLPIGGLKQKVLAAHAAGLTDGDHPGAGNRGDLDDVPEQVREEMTFHPVMTIGEVLELALLKLERRDCSGIDPARARGSPEVYLSNFSVVDVVEGRGCWHLVEPAADILVGENRDHIVHAGGLADVDVRGQIVFDFALLGAGYFIRPLRGRSRSGGLLPRSCRR